MKLRYFIALAILWIPLSQNAWAYDRDHLPKAEIPDIPDRAPSLAGFAPHGWVVEKHVEADFNNDGLTDLGIVIRQNSAELIVGDQDATEYEHFNSNPRTLIVAIKTKGGYFRRVSLNNEIIPRIYSQNIDDPFDMLWNVKDTLRLRIIFWTGMGTWSMFNRTFIFRWDDEAMRLIGYDEAHVHRGTGDTEDISVNYLTGREKITNGHISNDNDKVRWKRLPKMGPILMKNIGNGYEFDPHTGTQYSPK